MSVGNIENGLVLLGTGMGTVLSSSYLPKQTFP